MASMQPLPRFLLFFFVLLPLSAQALTFDDFLNDVELFDQDLQRMQIEEQQLKAEQELEMHEELFPVDESAVPALTDEYVKVMVDEKEIELTDVPAKAWFAQYVKDMDGIMSGYRDEAGDPIGLFGPADNVTIEQLSKIAIESAGIDVATCGTELRNTRARGRWSEEYIRCAEFKGFVVYNEGSVSMTRPATRAEVVVTFLQAFRVPFEVEAVSPFTDVNSATEFSTPILRAATDGIVAGYKDESGQPRNLFGPQDPVQRDAVAKIASLCMKVYQAY